MHAVADVCKLQIALIVFPPKKMLNYTSNNLLCLYLQSYEQNICAGQYHTVCRVGVLKA